MIHKHHGHKYKPKICRNFPFLNEGNQMVCGSFKRVDMVKS
ncbi:MAG: hypothetical protein DRP84_10775 [Spirochaetes bacterium]|nr:MAG: hypothetical protein DRP84_10775 [Spirochaetota bacterium]